MITSLPERIAGLPAPARSACERLVFVERVAGRAAIPPEMEPWVRQSFGSPDAVREQTIVRVVNRHTLEATLFNPLRALRPSGEAVSDEQLEAWVQRELAGHDFFADPWRETTADVFGRIEGRYCVSASNVAKYDGWHGLVVFAEPHPLRFGPEQLADYLDVALRWIRAAHAADPGATYPMITWNCLPKSGATIVHGHMQVSLARGMHYGRPELWRLAAERYRGAFGAGYFDDLAAVHRALGLGLHDRPRLRSFAHLTPLRNREVVFLGAEDVAALAGALYEVLRGLIDGQGVRALNLGIALPPLAPAPESWDGVPIVARIADRGPALTTRNDWGAMELYASGCVTADPFEVAERLRGTLTG